MINAEYIHSWFYYLIAMASFLAVVLFCLCYFPPNYKELNPAIYKKEQILKIDFVGIVSL